MSFLVLVFRVELFQFRLLCLHFATCVLCLALCVLRVEHFAFESQLKLALRGLLRDLQSSAVKHWLADLETQAQSSSRRQNWRLINSNSLLVTLSPATANWCSQRALRRAKLPRLFRGFASLVVRQTSSRELSSIALCFDSIDRRANC